MTVLVLSEGARDVGNLAEGKQGAVAVLVRRLLSEAWDREVSSWEVETGVLRRIHQGKGFERKAELAVVEAQARGHRAVVIVVDRDGPKNTTRLDALRRGRDEVRKNIPRQPHR